MREWDRWAADQVVVPSQDVKTFTPVWGADFSSAPTTPLSYIDGGEIAIIFNATSAVIADTSTTTTLTLSGLPDSITPGNRTYVQCLLIDNSLSVAGVARVDNNGTITFGVAQVSGTVLTHSAGANFTAANLKGLEAGWYITYRK